MFRGAGIGPRKQREKKRKRENDPFLKQRMTDSTRKISRVFVLGMLDVLRPQTAGKEKKRKEKGLEIKDQKGFI